MDVLESVMMDRPKKLFKKLQKKPFTLLTNLERVLYSPSGRNLITFVFCTIDEFVKHFGPNVFVLRIVSTEIINDVRVNGKKIDVLSCVAEIKDRIVYLGINHRQTVNQVPSKYLFEICEREPTINKNAKPPKVPSHMLHRIVDEQGMVPRSINIHYTSSKIKMNSDDFGVPEGFVSLPSSSFTLYQLEPGHQVFYSKMDNESFYRNESFFYNSTNEKTYTIDSKVNDIRIGDDLNLLNPRALTIKGLALDQWTRIDVISGNVQIISLTPETAPYFRKMAKDSISSDDVFIPFCGSWDQVVPDFVLPRAYDEKQWNNLFVFIHLHEAPTESKTITIRSHDINVVRHHDGIVTLIFH